MIHKDYHGFTLAEALRDAELMINSVLHLAAIRPIDAEFIVGRGVIRTNLLTLLTDLGYSPRLKLGNDGVIVCVIE